VDSSCDLSEATHHSLPVKRSPFSFNNIHYSSELLSRFADVSHRPPDICRRGGGGGDVIDGTDPYGPHPEQASYTRTLDHRSSNSFASTHAHGTSRRLYSTLVSSPPRYAVIHERSCELLPLTVDLDCSHVGGIGDFSGCKTTSRGGCETLRGCETSPAPSQRSSPGAAAAILPRSTPPDIISGGQRRLVDDSGSV